MKNLALALLISLPALAGEPYCADPSLVNAKEKTSCVATAPGCLKSEEDFLFIMAGMDACASATTPPMCLVAVEYQADGQVVAHCGPPLEK